MWIDCHAHLDRLPEKELAGILNEAADAGVSIVLSTATDISSAVTVVRQCRTFPALYGAAGISPCDVLSLADDWEEQLCTLLAELDHSRKARPGTSGKTHLLMVPPR